MKATETTAATAASGASTVHTQVAALIKEAGELNNSMLAKCRDAARIASAEFDKSKPVAVQVATVVAAYAEEFKAAGHNVKSLFSDALWLLAAPATDTVEVKIAGAKPGDKPAAVAPADAVAMPKHVMRDAAKQVRESVGAGRAAGAGRKAATPAATPTATKQIVADQTVSADVTFYAELDERLAKPSDLARIVAALERAGYKVTKAGKSAPAAKATAPAAPATLAAQLKAA